MQDTIQTPTSTDGNAKQTNWQAARTCDTVYGHAILHLATLTSPMSARTGDCSDSRTRVREGFWGSLTFSYYGMHGLQRPTKL